MLNTINAQYHHRRIRMIRFLASHCYRALRAGLLCFVALGAFSSVVSAAGLFISVDGPSTISAGANITYTISISNVTPAPITDVTMGDPLPGTLTFVSLAPNISFTCTAPSFGSGGVISCNNGTVPANSTVQFVLVANIPSGTATGTMFTNTAGIPPLNLASSTVTVTGSADLSITNSVAATSTSGSNIVYTIVVTNNGPDTADTPTVNNPTPAGLTFVSNTGGCFTAFPCSIPTLLSGFSTTITSTFSTTGATSGTIADTASVSSPTSDATSGNNSALASTNMIPQADISITKTGPPTAIVGNNITYTITVSNAGPSAAILTAVSDTIPVGTAFVSATPSVGSCSGTSTVSCFLGTLASAGSASIALVVHLNTNGTISNTATAGASTTDPTPGNNSATATTTVIAPPTFFKSFNSIPSVISAGTNGGITIPLNGTTPLRFLINNPNSTSALTAIGFTDALPAGLIVATPNGLGGTCGGGTITAVAGSGSVSLAGATLAASGSCVFSVTVKGITAGQKLNTTSAISSSEGGAGSIASAGMTVSPIVPPEISKAFGAGIIAFNATTSLSFTINNPNPFTALSALAFADPLPAGLIVSTPNGLSGVCGGTITAVAGSSSVSLAGGSLAAGASCTFSVTVTGTSTGVKTNTTSAISSTETGTGASANASLTVALIVPATISKAFGARVIPFNAITTLSFSITNPNAGSTLTAIGFGDPLPAGLNVSTPNGLTGSCGGGTITAVAGSGSVSLAGATLAAKASCTFSVNVKGTTEGAKANITSAISSAEAGAGTFATASLNVGAIVQTTVTSTFPASGAAAVPIGNALTVTFSRAMSPATINTSTFILQQGNTPVAGTVSYTGVIGIFVPSSTLAPNTLYTATITTGAQDVAGNALVGNYVWSFTTGTSADKTPPTVTSTVPANGATHVTPSANVTVIFSEIMNPLTVSTATFTLVQETTPAAAVTQQQGTTSVPGTVAYTGTSATFRPDNNLAANTRYSATLIGTSTDLAGNPLTANYQWSFTTGASADQIPVCLASFAILSGSTIVNAGASTVTGDIGVSSAGSVTGFPPGTLIGTTHADDSLVAKAMLDLSAAYTDAVSRSVGAVPVAGDLSGQTLTSGLYKSVSSLSIGSGNLTLDAKGDANAIFIFQMESTLTTGVGSQVILAGGASASNVFWQVGTAATLGTKSVFNGSILADQSIILNTGATVNGRLLAKNGPVTLESNTVTSPPPSISIDGIVNAASDSRTAVAGSIESVFGHNLGSALMLATGYPLSTTLGGSSFQIGAHGAPLYMTSCSQQNLQIPWEAEGQVTVTATVGGLVSPQQTLALTKFAPGIFSLNQAGSGQGAVEIAPTSQLAAPLSPVGHPVKSGEYIAIFCTGLGPVSNQPATGAAALADPLSHTLTLPIVTIGGAPAAVSYSGLAPGFAGLYQVNVLVPDGVSTGDNVTLVISMGGVRSNTVTIAIQ